MSTGIVEATGSVQVSTPTDQGARVEIAAGGLELSIAALLRCETTS